MKKKFKILSKGFTICKLTQGILFREQLVSGKLKLRIEIKTDSYPNQAHAYIETLGEDLKWNKLYVIPWPLIKTDMKLHYTQSFIRALSINCQPFDTYFQADRHELLNQAYNLLT